MSTSALTALFAYKAWASTELFHALSKISADLHPNALHSAIRTMNHMYVVDRIFRAHMLGEPHGYRATQTAETPKLSTLQAAVAATDAWYAQYLAQATPQQLSETVCFTFTDGDTGCMTREEMLLHVITHGGYHRGTLARLLNAVSIAPPRDLFTRYLHVAEPIRRELI
jgi:uncharacterized damage-inducible protein DinB